MWHIHTVAHYLATKWSSSVCDSTENCWKHPAEWKKPHTDATHCRVLYPWSAQHRQRCGNKVDEGLGERRECRLLMGMRRLFRMREILRHELVVMVTRHSGGPKNHWTARLQRSLCGRCLAQQLSWCLRPAFSTTVPGLESPLCFWFQRSADVHPEK